MNHINLSDILSLFIYLFKVSNCTQAGCVENEFCSLSLQTNNPYDILYCTSSVTKCDIYCTSPYSCQSLTIYSSADSTNIICNSTSSCSNTSIHIGDLDEYPSGLRAKQFTNDNSITATISCDGQESCSSSKIYFDGTDQDSCTVSSTNTNSFQNGYFYCNNNIDSNTQSQCTLYCDNIFQNECDQAALDCDEASDTSSCKCNGDGCNSQNVDVIIYFDNATTSSSPIVTSTTTQSETKAVGTLAIFSTSTFKYIIIGVVGLVAICGCALCICCWKFEAIYDYFDKRKTLVTSTNDNAKLGLKNVDSKSYIAGQQVSAVDDKHSERQGYDRHSHRNQNNIDSHTLSHTAQSYHNTDDEDQRFVKHVNNIELTNNRNGQQSQDNSNAHSYQDVDRERDRDRDRNDSFTHNQTQTNTSGHFRHGTDSIDTSRDRMPSSWYKYKEQKQLERTSIDLTNTIISPTQPESKYDSGNYTTTATATTTTQLRSSIISPQSGRAEITSPVPDMAMSPSLSADETPQPHQSRVPMEPLRRARKTESIESHHSHHSQNSHNSHRSRRKHRKLLSNENIANNLVSPSGSGKKKPQKQNKKRKKSGQVKRRKRSKKHSKESIAHYQKIGIEENMKINKKSPRVIERHKMRMKRGSNDNVGGYRRSDNKNEDTESSSDESDSDSDTDSETDSDSSTGTDISRTTTDSDTDDETVCDGDTETQQTVNVDDMLVNMVMMMQKTPNDDDKKNLSASFPKTQPVPEYSDAVS